MLSLLQQNNMNKHRNNNKIDTFCLVIILHILKSQDSFQCIYEDFAKPISKTELPVSSYH